MPLAYFSLGHTATLASVAAELSALLPTGDSDRDAAIALAIAKIQEALAVNLWVGESQLWSVKGGRVYDRMRSAADALSAVQGVPAAVSGVDTFRVIGRAIAVAATNEAEAAGVLPAITIAKARAAIEIGDHQPSASSALGYYAKAWNFVK